jgi:hypothetical protein
MQRKLGRCILLLQQYEHLLKRMIRTSSSITSTDCDGQIATVALAPNNPKTLGQLMGQFTTKVLVPNSHKPDEDEDNRIADSLFDEGKNVFVVRHQISMESSRHDATRRVFASIVSMRNELVHHFIEKFDLWSVAGCADADAHLKNCYAEIRASFVRLREFATSMQEAGARAAELIASEEFEDFVDHGILPNGAGVDWPRSTIAGLLREAEVKYAEDG